MGFDKSDEAKDDKQREDNDEQKMKKLPIINPLVCLPSWPK